MPRRSFSEWVQDLQGFLDEARNQQLERIIKNAFHEVNEPLCGRNRSANRRHMLALLPKPCSMAIPVARYAQKGGLTWPENPAIRLNLGIIRKRRTIKKWRLWKGAKEKLRGKGKGEMVLLSPLKTWPVEK
jgi:hypothetical protein